MKLILTILLTLTQLQASDYKLVGKAKLEVTIFNIDVYDISYFKKGKLGEKVELKYLRDVEKKYSVQGWNEGLKSFTNKKDKAPIQWLINTSTDIKEGDNITIIKENKKVTFFKNKINTFTSKDEGVYRLVFKPWIGENPVSKSLKTELLGNL